MRLRGLGEPIRKAKSSRFSPVFPLGTRILRESLSAQLFGQIQSLEDLLLPLKQVDQRLALPVVFLQLGLIVFDVLGCYPVLSTFLGPRHNLPSLPMRGWNATPKSDITLKCIKVYQNFMSDTQRQDINAIILRAA
jgi:hypothetical protein